ncbi:MAG: autotransporter outer membrane beta-barrel domain-containing protein [Alphaproteobacteria bacterium]|nr:autotransporter outer membrane beta-barrel domain-containing protein [Alphaproteobacteria bacterium]
MKQSKATVIKPIMRSRTVLNKCLWLNALAFVLCVPAVQAFDDFSFSSGEKVISGKEEYLDVNISGGELRFLNTGRLLAKNISISGGTFSGPVNMRANNLEISGGDFSAGGTSLLADDIVIDSDNVPVWGKPDGEMSYFTMLYVPSAPSAPSARKSGGSQRLTVLGNGLSVSNTVMQFPTISGKIIGNKDSFIGNFKSVNKWDLDSGTLYSIKDVHAYNDTIFLDIELELNDNAVAGTSNIMFDGNQWRFKDKLTDDEISQSVNLIMEEIYAVNEGSRNVEDFSNAFLAATRDFYIEDGMNVVAYLDSLWKEDGGLSKYRGKDIATRISDLYYERNDGLDSWGASVAVVFSQITMNDTSSLISLSAEGDSWFSSQRSMIKAAGNNTIVSKNIAFVMGSALIVDDDAALNLVADGDILFETSQLVVNKGGVLNVLADGDILFETSQLVVNKGGILNDLTENNHLLLYYSDIELSGTINGNIEAMSDSTVSFNSSAARLNGTLTGTSVNLNFRDNYVFKNIVKDATFDKITIADGKTLDIGASTLAANRIEGGTIKAVLTDVAKDTAIVKATAENVTLDLDMSAASRKEVTEYKITEGYGFSLGYYNSKQYAVSGTVFDKSDAGIIGILDSAWNGGSLYILRLQTMGEKIVETLNSNGISVSLKETNGIAAIDDKMLDDLFSSTIRNGDYGKMKQMVQEITPTVSQSALVSADSVLSLVSTRMSGGITAAIGKGRAGGDYTAGSASVWAKGMYNKARLSGENGFNSDSTGFAAGVEYHNDDSFKAGFGYVYTVSGINTTWSKTDADTHSGFVYGEYKPSAFYINGILSYGFSKYDEKTRLLGLKSEYDTETLAFQVLTGYMFGILTPETGVRYTKAFQKSYINALGVKMNNQKFETWTGVVGMKVSKDVRLAKYMITPEAKISLTYDFQREDFKRTVTLANGSGYVVEGEGLKRAGAEISGGVSVKAGNHTDIGVSYEGKFKKDYADHTGLLNIKYNF